MDACIPSMRARALDACRHRRSDFEANCGGQKPQVRLRRPYQKCRTSICGGPSCTISPTCHSSAELQLYYCSASDPSRWPRNCMVYHPLHHYISVQAALQLKQFAVAKRREEVGLACRYLRFRILPRSVSFFPYFQQTQFE